MRNFSGGTVLPSLDTLHAGLEALQPSVEAHITHERVCRYLRALADTPAPSTTASAMRAPVLKDLLDSDNALADGRIELDMNFANTASTVLTCGDSSTAKPLWYFAHLDTISYLIGPFDKDRYALVPFCFHLTKNGARQAQCYRFDLATSRYAVVSEGVLETEDGSPFYRPSEETIELQSGDRVVPVAPCQEEADGHWTGHFDNAGGVAALAVAAPVLASAGFDAMLAFPDEEEGPMGSGNQMIGRGGSRIINRLEPPDLAMVIDMQQALDPENPGADNPEDCAKLGEGAVLSEFSSIARGAVTPPHLFAMGRHVAGLLSDFGVKIQEPRGYTSRSDDVSVMLKTPNILLLGFPGLNRHFDQVAPKANPADVMHLSKALVYMALLQPFIRSFATGTGGGA